MARPAYSTTLCNALEQAAAPAALLFRRRRLRRDPGERLRLSLTGVDRSQCGVASVVLEAFLGGGFAGQVYRCRIAHLDAAGAGIAGLVVGGVYALKILVPPSRGALFFRNLIYWLGFQGPFGAQVNPAACRAGLLWHKLIRRAAGLRFGRETAIKDTFASFFDPELGAYGEITEWIEGRTWRLETDPDLRRRRDWRTVPLEQTASAEYVAKRRFMAGMVDLLHDLGTPELARQFEWWTLKSQPNVLKRTDMPDTGPESGLCAIDLRPGLALLPFLPMSPGDVPLIVGGLLRRRALVQFDRCDFEQLERFVAAHAEAFRALAPVIAELRIQDRAYRRAQPDLTRQTLRLCVDADLRRDVRSGLVDGSLATGLVDEAGAARLRDSAWRFALFRLLGLVPIAGPCIRRAWCHGLWRRHVGALLRDRHYRRTAIRARTAGILADWHRAGRIGAERVEHLRARPALVYLERMTVALSPSATLHRLLAEPQWALARLSRALGFLRAFYVSADERERWFLHELDEGFRHGMLTAAERAALAERVREPFIVKYLKCLAVHFATLPVTQLVSLLVGAVVAAWLLLSGRGTPTQAAAVFGGIMVAFQVMPISPGSLCRGGYVLYLMIRERNLRDYLIAAPLSFVKYIGYLAFPLQMVGSYPALARFMASRWATAAVHAIPVFGESGALLEHWVFDLFFNIPQALARWMRPRVKPLLTGWLVAGVALWCAMMTAAQWPITTRFGVNATIAVVCLFVLPRMLFYPVFWRRR